MLSEVLKLFGKLFIVITALITVCLYLAALVLEPALFYLTSQGLNAGTYHLSVLPFWFLNLQIGIPVDLNVGIVFFVLWTVFTLSFVAAWKTKTSFPKTIKEVFSKPTGKLFNNSLLALPVINCMTLLGVIVLNSLQEAGGIPTGTSPIADEPFLGFFDLSYSAVVEEVGFRLLPIGVFLFLVLLVVVSKKQETVFSKGQKVKLLFLAVLFPEKAKTKANTKTISTHGIKNGISPGEWGILVFTSLVFGLAHFNPGVSWELGKISSATLAGLVIGLSYLVYGAHAAIISHWFFNSYTDTYILLSEVYPVTESISNVVAGLSLTLGLLGWMYVAYFGYNKLQKTKPEQDSQLEPSTSPPVSL